jgi:hypothetical protein
VKTLLALLIALFVPALVTAQNPQQVADDLLAADRAFSAASAKTDLVAGLTAMFASDVAMMAPVKLRTSVRSLGVLTRRSWPPAPTSA